MVPRVLLVAGPGGAGVSTAAAQLVDRFAAEGRPVTVLDDDPYDGAGARCHETSVRRAAPQSAAAGGDTLARVLESFGGSAELVAPVLHTASVSAIRLLWCLPLDAPADHRIVVDAGASGPELARLARTLPGTLLRLSRLVPGWVRAGRPRLGAMSGRRSGAALLDQLQSAVRRARAIRQAVCGASGGALLVAGDAAKTSRLGVGIALSGVRVRGVLGLHDADASLLPGVPRIAAGDRPSDLGADGDLPLRIEPDDVSDGYRLRMLLPLNDFRQLAVRWAGHSLTLSAYGHESVLELPSALQRCHPSGARLRDGMLDVAFRPTRAGD